MGDPTTPESAVSEAAVDAVTAERQALAERLAERGFYLPDCRPTNYFTEGEPVIVFAQVRHGSHRLKQGVICEVLPVVGRVNIELVNPTEARPIKKFEEAGGKKGGKINIIGSSQASPGLLKPAELLWLQENSDVIAMWVEGVARPDERRELAYSIPNGKIEARPRDIVDQVVVVTGHRGRTTRRGSE